MAEAKSEKLSAKELRRRAKALGIEDWEEMTLAQLRTAVSEAEAAKSTKKEPAARRRGRAAAPEPEEDEDSDGDVTDDEDELDEFGDEEDAADDDGDDDDTDLEADDEEDDEPAPARGRRAAPAKKSAAKKAPAKAAKKAAPAATAEVAELPENGNPFKPKTNMFYIAEELIKGGKRSAMVKRLSKKVVLTPRGDNPDFDTEAELDRRILITGQILRKKYKFNVVKDGRGHDATIVAERP